MSVLVKGGGDRGQYLDVDLVPDSTLETELDALKAAGTDIVGKLITLTTAANYECTSAADGAVPDGKVDSYEIRGSTYVLHCKLWHYTDQNTTGHTAKGIINIPYSSIALGDTVEVSNGTTFYTIRDATSGGWGFVIAKDVPGSGYCDVLF
ncbi:MAG: hypothetical protein PHX83_12115 [Acidobacteriia bacterium]|nr:hypothetical protein [Terriglobia bacterium]